MSRFSLPNTLRAPLLLLLHPRKHTAPIFAALALGTAIGVLGMWQYDWPLWIAAALTLALLFIPSLGKWRADLQRYGRVAMGLSFLLMTQGFHSIEHIIQWIQFHVLNWTARNASGVLSPADSEWVHFTWNMLVFVVIALLVVMGLQNRWAWALLVWAFGHTIEHTYMFVRYLLVLDRLENIGIHHVTAQGLPGILGEGGWLALSEFTRGTFLSRLPGLATAARIDVHFWWNMGEIILLVLAAHVYLRAILSEPDK